MNQAQPNLLELAKQGNAKAIATLMNRQLQPKGITAKAALKDGCLQIMLESAQVPNQEAFVAFIRKGISGLGATSIEKLKIYGRQIGEEFPSWSQELELFAKSLPLSNSTGDQSTTPNALKQQKQLNPKILADNDNFSKAIDKLTAFNLDTGLILACVI
ncbi:MAG: hypothetical protein Fur006_28210 [Coleofasciculaceae cyanobacterium]